MVVSIRECVLREERVIGDDNNQRLLLGNNQRQAAVTVGVSVVIRGRIFIAIAEVGQARLRKDEYTPQSPVSKPICDATRSRFKQLWN